LHNNPDAITFIFDIENFFPSVDYRAPLSILKSLKPDPIAFDILDKQYTRWGVEHGGVPQGCPGSPFLSNLILRDIDEDLEGMDIFYLRYADDGLIITKNEQQLHPAIRVLDDGLRARGLKLHERKSHIVKNNWFEFLGVLVSRRGKLRIPPEAWQKKEQMQTKQQIRGWNSHYCFTWRWNKFLRGARDKMDIVNSLAVERADGIIAITTEKAKQALYREHLQPSRSGCSMGHSNEVLLGRPRNTNGITRGAGVIRFCLAYGGLRPVLSRPPARPVT
jgi:hypothetical protein